ncbi:hypothetical protein NQ315_013777 [Exocentrus adspersus]|uniref:Dynein heavy chain tail domain-containing protein n=1 Tax=Exocentrus adspersus TaxID=1586481 RepID=A0AAV8W4E2_9CUCU|nr:hypothetical protein NQ315_013777 [Exocentrus adspersus]
MTSVFFIAAVIGAIDDCHIPFIFENHMAQKKKMGKFTLDNFMPPVAGTLRLTYNLTSRLVIPMRNFKALQHPITGSVRATEIIYRIENFIKSVDELNDHIFAEWVAEVPSQITLNLNQNLLARHSTTNELYLNFNPQLTAILREAHYLMLMKKSNIPEEVLELSKKNELLLQFTTSLTKTITWYNKIKKFSKKVEIDLIEEELAEIDKLISTGQNELSWNSTVYEYGGKGRHVIFKRSEETLSLDLLYHEEHYNVITLLTAAFYSSPLRGLPQPIRPQRETLVWRNVSLHIPSSRNPHLSTRLHVKIVKDHFEDSCYTNHAMPESYEKSTVCQQIKRCKECL